MGRRIPGTTVQLAQEAVEETLTFLNKLLDQALDADDSDRAGAYRYAIACIQNAVFHDACMRAARGLADWMTRKIREEDSR